MTPTARELRRFVKRVVVAVDYVKRIEDNGLDVNESTYRSAFVVRIVSRDECDLLKETVLRAGPQLFGF